MNAAIELAETLRMLGGVARTAALVARGHSRYRLDEAIRSRLVRRVRRGWVALPTADADLVAAARLGVVLTCVTQAERLGLWAVSDGHQHVAAAPHGAGGKPAGITVHWAEPLVPRHPDALVDPVENVLALAAACQPRERALTLWESAFRLGLAAPAVLARLPLGPTARALADSAWTIFDSGLETIFAVRLGWLGVRLVPQAWLLGHRVDFLIGDRLVVQIDGGHHVGPQRTRDIAHDALLQVHGYHVIRLSYSQIMADWPGVQDVIVRAIAVGLHRAA